MFNEGLGIFKAANAKPVKPNNMVEALLSGMYIESKTLVYK